MYPGCVERPNGRRNPGLREFVARFGPTPQTNTAKPFYRSLHILLRPIPLLFHRHVVPNENIICGWKHQHCVRVSYGNASFLLNFL